MEKENWLLEETLLHEKYQIKKVLGQGGFGITYLAYDQTLQQNVAIFSSKDCEETWKYFKKRTGRI